MKTLIIAVLSLTLIACGELGDSEVKVSGGADIGIEENFTECEVRQNASSLIVRQNGNDDFVFIFDPAVTYPDEYQNLTIADTLRVTPYTADEQAIIDGTL